MSSRTRLRRATRRNPCPICGKPDWCGYDDEVAICMREPNGALKEAVNGGWIHLLSSTHRNRLPPWTEEPTPTLASCQDRNLVYQTLLNHLPLRPHHYQQLKDRGFSDDAIQRRGYKTLPPEGERGRFSRAALGFGIGRAAGKHPSGIPGFCLKDGPKGQRWTIRGPGGLMVPVRDLDDRIVGCQVRVDNPSGGGKYRWLSSRDAPGGTPAKAEVHVARAPCTTDPVVWITEGPLKADRAAESLGATVLAVPGVGNWRNIPATIQRLGARQIVLAYDMDMLFNPQVRLHAQQLVDALAEIRFDVPGEDATGVLRLEWASWDGGRAKGLDDALQAWLEIDVLPL